MNEAWMDDTKFCFQQRVKVIKGFFRGRKGEVMDCTRKVTSFGTRAVGWRYQVLFGRAWEPIWFDEECIEQEGEIDGQEEEKTTADL